MQANNDSRKVKILSRLCDTRGVGSGKWGVGSGDVWYNIQKLDGIYFILGFVPCSHLIF